MSTDDRRDADVAAVRAYVREIARPAAGWLLIVAGTVALVAGWFGVSREALVARQVPYFLSGGLGGLAAVVVGVGLTVVHDMRRAGERLDRLDEKLTDLHRVLLVEAGSESVPDGQDGPVLVVPGGQRFHTPECPVVRDKDGREELTRRQADLRGYVPCGLCEPTTSPRPAR